MPILCKPAVAMPENVLTLEETLAMAREIHAQHPQLALALRLIKNVGVEKRHIVRPVAEILDHPGLERRNEVYEEEAKKRIPAVVAKALANAELEAAEIDAIIVISCTGFLMPSLTAWMLNTLGFRYDVAQIPIAQLGCAAGGSSIARAMDFCNSHRKANVLIVSCEFCSLCYQPDDLEVGNLLSNALFGDAIAAAVMRGEGGRGINMLGAASHVIPGTEDWISYKVKATGFHFRLNKGVPGTMAIVSPTIEKFVQAYDLTLRELDYHVIHTGGPRVLDTVRDYAHIPEARLEFSRRTLREYGNIASASIFDVMLRIFDTSAVRPDATFLIAGFGPGITAELSVGKWVG